MEKKVAIITGGTSGVGLSITKALANKRYCVYFIGSNKRTGIKIEEELRTLGNDVHYVQLDLSDLKQVQNFVGEFSSNNERLDILFNIAGVLFPKRQLSNERIEKTFAIGYLSAYILSNSLSSLLIKTNNSRIINVGGDLNILFKTKLNFEDLNLSEKYSGIKAAFNAMHAKTVLTEILAEKFKDSGINVLSFHPGIVKSNLTRNLPFPIKWITKFVYPFMSSESKSGIYLATSDNLTGKTGHILINDKFVKLRFDKFYKEKLLNETEKIVQKLKIAEV